MRTNKVDAQCVCVLRIVFAMMLCPGLSVAGETGHFAPGVSAGVVYTPASDFSGIGWTASGSIEHLVGEGVEIRARIGFATLHEDISGANPDVRYGFLVADAVMLDMLSPTGGIGLYYLDLEKPLADGGESGIECGVNAGVRFFGPYHDGDHAFTLDGTIHHVFADGPSLLFTVAAGWLF